MKNNSRSTSSKRGGGGSAGMHGTGSEMANRPPSRKMSSKQRNAGKQSGVDEKATTKGR